MKAVVQSNDSWVEGFLCPETYKSIFLDHGRLDYFLLHQLGFVQYLQRIVLFVLFVNDMNYLCIGETSEADNT